MDKQWIYFYPLYLDQEFYTILDSHRIYSESISTPLTTKKINRQRAYIGRIWLLRVANCTVVVVSYFKPTTKKQINFTKFKKCNNSTHSLLKHIVVSNKIKKNTRKNVF